MRWAWVIAVGLAMTAGCQAPLKLYDGADKDAKFIFGGKWEQKEEGESK
jgi:hypothetical protein